MPYPNFHAARMRDPGDFEQLKTKSITDGITIIVGKLKGEKTTTAQAYRFDKDKFTASEAKGWLKDHDLKEMTFEAAKKETASTVFSMDESTVIVSGNTVKIPFVKDGTKALDATGKAWTITSDALDSSWDTWIGGIVTVNHRIKEKGIMSEISRDGEFVYATLSGLSDEAIDVINSKAYRGVSQESIVVSHDGDNITSLRGTGVTLVVFPGKPACPLSEGCGAPVASMDDPTYEMYDVGTENNTGTLVKIKEISLYFGQEVQMTDEERKTQFAREVGWTGPGSYMIFEHDETLKLGDEFPAEIEAIHTVDITVSNFPLNTLETNIGITSTHTRGTQMTGNKDGALEALQAEVEALKTGSTALTSEMSTLKEQIGQKDAEIVELKSTIAEKDIEIKKAGDNLETVVKSALEAHDQALAAKSEVDAVTIELKSMMPKEETFDTFMKTEPSVGSIKSMIAALKDVAPASHQAGAGTGRENEGEKTVSMADTAWDPIKKEWI